MAIALLCYAAKCQILYVDGGAVETPSQVISCKSTIHSLSSQQTNSIAVSDVVCYQYYRCYHVVFVKTFEAPVHLLI